MKVLTRYGTGKITKEEDGKITALLDEPFKGDRKIKIGFNDFFKFSPWAVVTIIRINQKSFAKIEFFDSKETAEYELSFSIPEDENGDVVIFLNLENGFFKKKGSIRIGNVASLKISAEDWKAVEVTNYKKIYEGIKAIRKDSAEDSDNSDIKASFLLTEVEQRILHFSIITSYPVGVIYTKEFTFDV